MTKTFLRQPQLAKRYATSVRTIQRMRAEGRLPKPDLFLGPFPLWSDETLESFEREAVLRVPPSKNGADEPEAA